MKMQKHWAWAALLILVLAISACAPAAVPTPAPTTPPAAPPKAAETAKPSSPAPGSPTPAAATPTPKPVTLKLGGVQSVSEAGTYIAVEKGYFKDQGITMEVNSFRTVAELIAPLGTGQLDVIVMTLSVPLLAAADRGVDFKIVATGSQNKQNWDNSWLILRKDLYDSGRVKTGADLKGMKVAIPSQGSLGDQVVQMLIEQGGLKPADVETVVLPFAEQAAAFGNKAISAGWAVEPFIIRGIQEGFSVKWMPTSQFFDGESQGSLVVFGSSMLKDQDLARRWMTAYLRGVRDYVKAFTTKEGRDQAVNALVKNTSIKEPKLYDEMGMPYVDPNGQLNRKSLDAQYKWFVDKGLYTGKKTLGDLIDLSYADYAVQKLGKQ